ncbi:MAG: 4'-phosphopantetheinyl transferase superfamily protein [Desulfotignum sp.]|nr:4'-phosphopantetheinyl transferase superfamily protein [Desulfotignum sp.]
MYPFPLQPGNVHLYYTCLDKIRDRALIEQYHRILSPAESETISKIRSEKKRHESLVTKALARYVLSRCCRIAPEAVRFCVNRHGKPALLPGVTPLPVQFNLSHCTGLVGCAVARDADVGIDMEEQQRCVNLNLARRFFSEPEIMQLEKIKDTAGRKALFLQLWTLKEAYIKAVGKGLSMGLDKFSFVFDQGRPDIRFVSEKAKTAGIWHFFTLTLLDRYTAAAGVRSGHTKRPDIHIYACIPFDSIQFQGSIP